MTDVAYLLLLLLAPCLGAFCCMGGRYLWTQDRRAGSVLLWTLGLAVFAYVMPILAQSVTLD
jgi:hypothetical protein